MNSLSLFCLLCLLAAVPVDKSVEILILFYLGCGTLIYERLKRRVRDFIV